MSALLELSGIAKSFGAIRALRGVSFDLQPGEVHALLGENGAGKSTLIKVITGAHAPDAGVIQVGDSRLAELTPALAHRLGIACIYQQPALFPDLTVAENIALRLDPPSPWRRVRPAEQRARAQRLLQKVGAEFSVETEVLSLSMPQQQLVEIACAIGAGARILIMDEPTASLTRPEQEQLFAIVRDLRRDGVGIIYISHRLEEIFALADRVTVLRDGLSVATERLRFSPPSEAGPAQPARSLTEAELIQMMIGREVSQIYPATESAAGEVLCSLHGLGCAASGVRDVNLEIRAGEVLGIAGLVGAGRTELARILFGLTPADAGMIEFAGVRMVIRSPREAMRIGIAYVPEDRRRHGVILEMPIAHNMTLAVHPQLFPGGWLRRGVERELAEAFMRDLDVKADGPWALACSLSGGNQQKVSVARWLATRPRLLILDEPTQGVDVGAKAEIHRLIRRFTRAGMAVLVISSDLPEVLGLSDRIAVMRGGTIVSMLARGATAGAVMAAALGRAEPKEVA